MQIKYSGLGRLMLTLPALCLTLACHKMKDEPAPDNTADITLRQSFESFWDNMNRNYLFWDIDTTDWDLVYENYQPLFAALDKGNPADVRKGYSYFKAMTAGLIDGHYTLMVNHTIPGVEDAADIRPVEERKKLQPGYHPVYDYGNTDLVYLDKGYREALYTTADGDAYVRCGNIGKRVLFLRFSQCNLKAAAAQLSTGVKPVVQYFFDQLHQPAIKGIIIDVRANNGGNTEDLDFIIGSMIDTPLHYGYTRLKSGNGRLDYTPWINAVIRPGSEHAVKIPIMVLADLYSRSVAELMTMAVGALPNGMVIGETTWGATSPLAPNEAYNGGPFQLSAQQFNGSLFYKVYTSSAIFKYKDNRIYEDSGFPPDILVKPDPVAFRNGRDMQLEKAVSWINQ